MKNDEWLSRITNGLFQYLKSRPEILIFILITFFVLTGFAFEKYNNEMVALGIQNNFKDADGIISKRLAVNGRLDSINLCKNLKTVYYYLDDLKKGKLELAKRYQGFVVTCFSLGVFFIAFGAVVGFVITKKGWDNSSRSRKALFLSCAFYGIVLSTFPKLFNHEQNYKSNFADYNALSKTQLYIFFKLSPYISKADNQLCGKDSVILNNTIDTISTVLTLHSNIDMNFDAKQLDNIKTFNPDK
jgi:hypothetical protein